MKKLLALALAMLFLLTAFASCTPKNDGETDTGDQKDMVVLFKKGVNPEYTIIYADGVNSKVESSANNLSYLIEQKLGMTVIATKEFKKWSESTASNTEILIGDTQRPESAEAKALLKGVSNEYLIKLFDNGRLVFVASNDASLREAVLYFTNTFVTSNTTDTVALEKGYEYYADLGETERAKWQLGNAIPEYTAGQLSKAIYQIGYGIACNSNAGKMQIAYDTTLDEFNTYLDTMKAAGYTEIASNEINGSKFVQFQKKKPQTVYVYYLAPYGEVRIISDSASVTETEFEFTLTPAENATTGIYQFAMMYDAYSHGSHKYPNNGAFHIIRLSDNSLILIDGGSSVQATPKATEALMDFLYEITDIDPDSGEKIKVACWYITHAHGDHYYFARNLFRDYSDKIDLERVMHNLPSTYMEKGLTAMASTILTNYPNVKFMKIHTGQNIQLGDATVEVLLTHETLTDAESGLSVIDEYNDTSDVLRITINGKSLLNLGDWGGSWTQKSEDGWRDRYKNRESKFMDIYKVESGTDDKGNPVYTYPALKADIVQVAHHAINDWMANVYNAIDADYAFIPTSDVRKDLYASNCFMLVPEQLFATGMKYENMYHANRLTHWLIIEQDGTITHGSQEITGYDEAYYYYVDANGKTLYQDEDGKINVEGKGTMITDDNGKQTITAEGITGVTSKYVAGYMEQFYNDKGELIYPPFNATT